MVVRRVFCCLTLVATAGCASHGPGDAFARMAGRLDRVEQVRRVAALRGVQRLGSLEQRSALSAGAFRLASYSANPRVPGSAVSSFALASGAFQNATGVAEQGGRPASGQAQSPPAVERRERPDPLPSLWDTIKRDVKQMPEELWHDTKKVYTSAPNLLILGATYGGALAVQQTEVDRTVEGRLEGNDVFSDGANEAFGVLGNPATHFALAGAWYLVGQQTQDEKTYAVGKKLFSALIINGLSTLAGQAATWDEAPNGEWGTFPSGHTSSTFCFASVMHEAYGPLVGFPLYGLGTLVAIERLDDDEHYFSDVVMGVVLGLVVGHTVAGEHELELFGGQLLPYADPNTGSSGVAWVTHFK